MREIKFKFIYKSLSSGIIMKTIHTLESIGNSSPSPFDPPIGFILLDRVEWTGLHDKNGKEIYEGDIVKVTSISFGTKLGQVRFAKSAFWYDFGEQDDGYNSELVFMPIRAEVIGNVFENKELLEK